MTVSELIEQRDMPSDATAVVWSRMDASQHRDVESVELATAKSDRSADVVVVS
jgi:hypothetical protein